MMDRRDEVSGVNYDEETQSMMVYSKAYQAIARVLTTMDDLHLAGQVLHLLIRPQGAGAVRHIVGHIQIFLIGGDLPLAVGHPVGIRDQQPEGGDPPAEQHPVFRQISVQRHQQRGASLQVRRGERPHLQRRQGG